MELSQDEKDRVIAEEKLRYETRKSLKSEERAGGCVHGGHAWSACGNGGCRRGGFMKGLIVGLVLCGLFSLWCRHRCQGPGGGRCYFGSQMSPDTPPAAPGK